ncbi:hypothetical protein AVEN_192089-1 [Araneus ventricosus]|uniref:Ty3 transposon capsid-like protein domain-containing protein n=1 Tax=Araneus ventricosus TaxID=182803 RepID=A0A4Y2B808_ARAVE|nr:hypothetical protein AVEN_192089-1 [Araneus ventricosus]
MTDQSTVSESVPVQQETGILSGHAVVSRPLPDSGLLSMLVNLKGPNYSEYFNALDKIGKLGGWSNDQLLLITQLKMEGPARRFYESSLKNNSELTFGVLKQKMIAHFKDEQSFAASFASFSSAQQYEHESIRDFSVRLQSLVNKSFSEEAESELSDSFRAKMLLSQFVSGLKQSIKAPVIAHDPSSFKEAVEFAIRVEKSQNLVCPNISAINSSQESELQKLKNQQSECSSKMELLVQQMALLNEQLSKLQTTGENRYPSRQAGPQNNRQDYLFPL